MLHINVSDQSMQNKYSNKFDGIVTSRRNAGLEKNAGKFKY